MPAFYSYMQEWWEELVGSAHPPPRFIIPAVGNTSQLQQIYISKRNTK
jgi:hypothetical protein